MGWGRVGAVLGLLLLCGSAGQAAPASEANGRAARGFTLQASAFMAATGALVPLELMPAGVSAPNGDFLGGYVQFARDPRMPTAMLLVVELPASSEPGLLRVSVREGDAPPKVRWVAVPAPLSTHRTGSVHVPTWVEDLSFCQDVLIEIASGERREAILRRVIRFTCPKA